MAKFECPEFKIDLPDGTQEASAYAFALHAREPVKPTVVVKWQKARKDRPLMRFAKDQQSKLGKQLPKFKVVEPLKPKRPAPAPPGPAPVGKHAARAAKNAAPTRAEPVSVHTAFEWTAGNHRLRQTQVYLPDGPRLYTLTCTSLAATADLHGPALMAALKSFRPKA